MDKDPKEINVVLLFLRVLIMTAAEPKNKKYSKKGKKLSFKITYLYVCMCVCVFIYIHTHHAGLHKNKSKYFVLGK